ncbi:MAG: M23 family metallopeptidase [Pseudomonadota bacterium]
MTKKLDNICSILIIPKGNLPLQEIEVSSRNIMIILGIALSALIISGSMLFSLMQSRQAYFDTYYQRLELAKYQKERTVLLAKVAALEEKIDRTARISSKINGLKGNLKAAKSKGLVDSLIKKMEWKAPRQIPLDNLMAKADQIEAKINLNFLNSQDQFLAWSSKPSVWPVKGWITSDFGWRQSFRTRTGGRASIYHEGIDLAAPIGTLIKATADGVVTFTGYNHGYGKTVKVKHGQGLFTLYAHCSKLLVKEGQKIKRGDFIATVGNTGNSTGPHLHYEIRQDGKAIDPMQFLVN